MLIKHAFANGEVTVTEVHGEVEAFYLKLAGLEPEDAPGIIEISALEKRAERKHTRAHKYTGIPVSYEGVTESGEQIADYSVDLTHLELGIDLAQALASLTDIQRQCFIEVCVYGKTQREMAAQLGKSKNTVAQAINGARKKLQKIL